MDPKFIVISSTAGIAPQYSLINPASGGDFGKSVLTLSTGNIVVTDPNVNSTKGAVYLFNGASGALISALQGSTGGGSGDQVGSGLIFPLTNGNFVVTSPAWNGTRGAASWGSGTTGINGVVSASNSFVGSKASDDIGSGGVLALSTGNYVVQSPNWNGAAGAASFGNGSTGGSGTVGGGNSLIGSNANDGVGGTVTALKNGSYVVVTTTWFGSRGAVTWGSGGTGVSGSISFANSLVGSIPGDKVGSAGVVILNNGNYVVGSPNWASKTGAATWGSGLGGVSGNITASNSLVGSASGDLVGTNILQLTNSNYVTFAPTWSNSIGEATWGSGNAGVTGNVTNSNSLIGTNPGDLVGTSVVALTNGNYVVGSPSWSGALGAVTWGVGTLGVKGVVANTNSLVGVTAGDKVGTGIYPLTNGNYVTTAPSYSTSTIASEGAAVWADGTKALIGVINQASSLLTGNLANDQVGLGGVVALTNGNYVVLSPDWNSNRGAATWGSGVSGTGGGVGLANSLIGFAIGDNVGTSATALTNGNYVVSSVNFSGAKGAATFGLGTSGITGVVSAAISLVGSTDGDKVGTLVTPLSNGSYVTSSSTWNGKEGEATWGSGTLGVTGAVNATNSIVGSNANDQVGSTIVTLSNGNYLVDTTTWSGNRGAVTFGSDLKALTGTVSALNSIVGTHANDQVGKTITQLKNGNYVVSSTNWNSNAGEVTWGSGTTGVSGQVGAANSLVGTTSGDLVGVGVLALASGNYVVTSPSWNGTHGAATWVNGTTGATLDGQNNIDSINSLEGANVTSGLGLAQAGPAAVAGSWVSNFATDGGGRVLIGYADPNQTTFIVAQAQTITLDPSFLTNSLDAGTNVTLKANDDITVSSPITVVPTGIAGNLILDAGRSVFVNANITTGGGNLTLIANDTVADGVVNAQRDPGTAVITMVTGATVNTGTGAFVVDLKNSLDKSNNAGGAATLLGITANSVTLTPATPLGVVINGGTAGDGVAAGTYTQTNVTGSINLNNCDFTNQSPGADKPG